VQHGLIPHMRIESNVRFSKHLVLQRLRERSFQPRRVNRNGAKCAHKDSRKTQEPRADSGLFIFLLTSIIVQEQNPPDHSFSSQRSISNFHRAFLEFIFSPTRLEARPHRATRSVTMSDSGH